MGDIWEQAVETYLAMDRGLFLNPQYLIGEPNDWSANADFLALEFPERRAWMVEVTKNPGARLFNKIRNFESGGYLERIRRQLESHEIISKGDKEWKIGFWIFAPQRNIDSLENRMRAADVKVFRATPLEDALAPSAWDSRFRKIGDGQALDHN